jgi:hypothetical protein
MTSRLRLAVMASHREEELRTAARILAEAALAAGFEPRARAAAAVEHSVEPTPQTAPAPRARANVFDFEAPESRAA